MKRAAIVGGILAVLLALVALIALNLHYRNEEGADRPPASAAPAIAPSDAPATEETHPAADLDQGFLFGRITTVDGATYEGRLRFGGDQEAFWGDFFNGAKRGNPWAANVPPERLPKRGHALTIFGFKITMHERPIELRRRFMTRLGDIARIESRGRQVLVTLKSGTVFELDRFEASDFDDGVRVWDAGRGVVDLDSLRIREIELLPTSSLGAVPGRLHGTVRTAHGAFTGFLQWDRQQCVGSDELRGRAANGERRLRFDTIRSIEPRFPGRMAVTQADGSTIELSGGAARGIYVDDTRYGRVLVTWDAFERVDFDAAGSGPAYAEFPPARPLVGSVTTRAGVRLAGRIVYDLDESETAETLDAPLNGVDYTIPFGLVASVVARGGELSDAGPARVTLRSGEELALEREGDLGEGNAGLLVFVEGAARPEYVPWSDVARVDFGD